jgi:hypothetical protein
VKTATERDAKEQNRFAELLRGGDRRSIGKADKVVQTVGRDPTTFCELWNCLLSKDALVRMRAADALEKVTRNNPSLLLPYRKALLAMQCDDGSPEVRWHLMAMAARVASSASDAKRLILKLDRALRNDNSRIVRVMALQAACEIAARYQSCAQEFARMLQFAARSPFPSLRARARRIAEASHADPAARCRRRVNSVTANHRR